jgi:superfamily I DNA/RNA helicase
MDYFDPNEFKFTPIPGSPEQEEIWHWLENGTENGLLEARAGTGKTFTIVNAVARLRGKRVGVFSFNNHIIKELNEKLKKEGIYWAKGYTFNAFGFKTIKNHPQLGLAELFNDKLPTLLAEMLPEDTAAENTVRYATERLVRLCKCYMEDGKDADTLVELAEKFNIDFNGDDITPEQLDERIDRVHRLVPRVLDLCLNRRATLDYDDQVWWTVKMRLPTERFDIVLVDEAQDTNKMQQELVKMVCP